MFDFCQKSKKSEFAKVGHQKIVKTKQNPSIFRQIFRRFFQHFRFDFEMTFNFCKHF